MPINYRDYPAAWPKIRRGILERAGHKCEQCGVDNYAVGYRDDDGSFNAHHSRPCDYKTAKSIADTISSASQKYIVIVLTIAHLNDRDPQNTDPDNLAAYCQRCHLLHDREQHAHNAAITRQRKADQAAGQSDLFGMDRI